MSNKNKLPGYRTQILRMWSESQSHQLPDWRFSLEDITTGVRSGFADLDALIEHLIRLTEQPTASRIEPATLELPPHQERDG